MITVTPEALEKIKEVAEDEGITELILRARVLGGGCAGFLYDLYFEDKEPTELDETFDIDDIKIVVDPLSFQYLDGCEIDWVETLITSGFKFNNPNVSATCGCNGSVSF